MRVDIGRMPRINEVAVVCSIILLLISCLQIVIIDALHTNKHLRTACLPGQGNEVLDFVGQDVHLYHKFDLDTLCFLQPDTSLKDLPPLLVTCKIIIREKIKINTRLPVILLDSLRNRFRLPHTHLASLHINNRAEAATKGAATSTINSAELFMDKAPQIFFVNHGDWRRA